MTSLVVLPFAELDRRTAFVRADGADVVVCGLHLVPLEQRLRGQSFTCRASCWVPHRRTHSRGEQFRRGNVLHIRGEATERYLSGIVHFERFYFQIQFTSVTMKKCGKMLFVVCCSELLSDIRFPCKRWEEITTFCGVLKRETFKTVISFYYEASRFE